MKKFMIEREIPKVGSMGPDELRDAASRSLAVLEQLGPNIKWVESFLTPDKLFCVYLASEEWLIRKHAELSGFPAHKITEIGTVIGVQTATDRRR
jgi:hypothetical protein